MRDVTRFFHPVLPAKKLRKEPVRVEVAGRAYALFRDAQGRVGALADACPHRLAPLSRGRVRPDGRLACPYHGWNFDAQGRGRNPSLPTMSDNGRCDTQAMKVVEHRGYLWIAAPGTDESRMPKMDWPGYEFVSSYSHLFEAPLHVALDNFSEDEHTPWVHTRLGWSEAGVDTIRFDAKNFDDRTEVTYEARQRDSLLTRLILLKPGDTFHNDWTTYFDPVRTIYTVSWSDQAGKKRPAEVRAPIFFVPETETKTRLVVFVFARLVDPSYRWLMPIAKHAMVGLSWFEVNDDRRFIPTVANTPFEMKGMRLGKYDKPLVHNHKLLKKIYWGEEEREEVREGAPS